MSANHRLFILHGLTQANRLIAFLRENAKPAVDRGRPLAVRVYEYKPSRSGDQNALMWVWLEQIAQQYAPGGQCFAAEAWNIEMKRQLLPEETASGIPKWVVLPSGEREIFMSTTDLNVGEMTEYLNRLQALAASEFGVQLTNLEEETA